MIETVEDLRVNDLMQNLNISQQRLEIHCEFLKDFDIMSIDLNKMSDSSVRIDNHFCMWMLLQLFEIMPLWRIVVIYRTLLQVSYLKTNTFFWCCLTKAAQVVRIYSDLNDFNQVRNLILKQVSDFLCNLLYMMYQVEAWPQPSQFSERRKPILNST